MLVSRKNSMDCHSEPDSTMQLAGESQDRLSVFVMATPIVISSPVTASATVVSVPGTAPIGPLSPVTGETSPIRRGHRHVRPDWEKKKKETTESVAGAASSASVGQTSSSPLAFARCKRLALWRHHPAAAAAVGTAATAAGRRSSYCFPAGRRNGRIHLLCPRDHQLHAKKKVRSRYFLFFIHFVSFRSLLFTRPLDQKTSLSVIEPLSQFVLRHTVFPVKLYIRKTDIRVAQVPSFIISVY